MDWREEYKRKTVSAEDAVKAVKSGDRVVIPLPEQPRLLPDLLATRAGELQDVEIFATGTTTEYAFFQPGLADVFNININCFAGSAPTPREALTERRADFTPTLFSLQFKAWDERQADARRIDVVMVVVSPPDDNGFCSFGRGLWNKKSFVKRATTVLAEVDKSQIRTFGNNFIHVSEIDYFTDHPSPPQQTGRPKPDERVIKPIAEYVSSLIKDGDTIQIGTGSTSVPMIQFGLFDGKQDLGLHTESSATGLVPLVREGIFTGERKTLHRGKVVCTSIWGNEEDLAFVNQNPMFELYEVEYVNDLRTIAANDNMVAINNALTVDLTGQVASESFGPRMFSGHGGMPEFAMAALLSKGGRSIVVLRSATSDGKLSRIVPMLEPGTFVTVPRTFGDYVVTEYGIASLLGKSHRQRAEQLINIAHPNFRGELKRQARKLFYP